MIEFEWDQSKAEINLAKHGIDFREAASVFYDDRALFMADPSHSDTEDRLLLLGLSTLLRLLLVVHTYRKDSQTIRIISARRASRSERRQYSERQRR